MLFLLTVSVVPRVAEASGSTSVQWRQNIALTRNEVMLFECHSIQVKAQLPLSEAF